MSNSEQEEFWNGAAGDIWVEAQSYLDEMLAPLSDLALAKAAATAGERVIDVGCGCGETSLALAQTGAEVWGLDISQPMLARAKERAAGNPRLAFSVGDAAIQGYTADHDLIFSRFGVMFFADPIAAFTNMRTALKDNGRLVFVCWQSPKDNLWMSVAGRAAQPYLPPPATPADPRAPGPFAFADPDWVREILQSAGYAGIAIDSLTPNLKVGATVDEAMYFQGRIGPMARLLAEVDDAVREQAMTAVREALAPYQGPDGVQLGSAAWLVSARAG